MFLKPISFMYYTRILLPYIYITFYIFFIYTLLLITLITYFEINQSDFFYIIYIHVPCAWLSIILYIIITLINIYFFINVNKIYFFFSINISKLNIIIIFITLITGSIWGKITWGVYWVWDARLTSVFILFLLQFCYLLLYYLNYNNSLLLYKIISFIGILGFLLIPIIKYSVKWWNTLHQVESITITYNSIHPLLYKPLFTSFITILFIVLYNIIINIRENILYYRKYN